MTLSCSLWFLCLLLLLFSFIHFYLFQVMSMLDPKTFDMFYFTGSKHTTPNCPIDLKPDLNPSSGAQSYEGSDVDCSRNALYNIPFFLENLGPRFSEWSVNAHEARPGHHTQVRKTVPCPTLAPPVREIISVLCTRHQVCTETMSFGWKGHCKALYDAYIERLVSFCSFAGHVGVSGQS